MTARPRLSRAALAKSARATRRRVRAGLGPLKDRLVSKRTLRTYRAHVRAFFRWVEVTGRSLPSRTVEFDCLLCEFAQSLWEEGDSKAALANTICGLTHEVEMLKGRLHGVWRLFHCWGRSEAVKRAPPINSANARALAGYFLHQGYVGTAIMVLVAHHCCLRTAEMLGLLTTDITVAQSGAVLVLRETKIGSTTGVTETVSITDKQLALLLKRWIGSRTRGLPACDASSYQFRKIWKEAVAALELPEDVQPYGLRRGGATELFQFSGSFDVVADVGRWNTLKAARIYVTTALAEWAGWNQSTSSIEACTRYANLWEAVL